MIPHKPIFANIRDNNNLGDMLCGAKGLFPEFADSPEMDFRQVTDGPEPLILGGGGMIHPGVDDWIKSQAYRRMVFAVGVGINYHDRASMNGWESKIRPCSIAGLRDKKFALAHDRFEYCPCPTTGLFDWETARAAAAHENDLLVFQHYDRPIFIPFRTQVPVYTNRWRPGATLEETAVELGKFQRVLTNSYHGALWALRMGCQVALFQPFSTRFSTGLPVSLPVVQIPIPRSVDEVFEVWKSVQYRNDVDKALREDYSFQEGFLDHMRTLLH